MCGAECRNAVLHGRENLVASSHSTLRSPEKVSCARVTGHKACATAGTWLLALRCPLQHQQAPARIDTERLPRPSIGQDAASIALNPRNGLPPTELRICGLGLFGRRARHGGRLSSRRLHHAGKLGSAAWASLAICRWAGAATCFHTSEFARRKSCGIHTSSCQKQGAADLQANRSRFLCVFDRKGRSHPIPQMQFRVGREDPLHGRTISAD